MKYLLNYYYMLGPEIFLFSKKVIKHPGTEEGANLTFMGRGGEDFPVRHFFLHFNWEGQKYIQARAAGNFVLSQQRRQVSNAD